MADLWPLTVTGSQARPAQSSEANDDPNQQGSETPPSPPTNGQPQQSQPPAYGQSQQQTYGVPQPLPGLPPGIHVQPVIDYDTGMPGAVHIDMQTPQQIQWMERPKAIAGCPPGLEYLTQIDQLLVHQQINMMEVMTNYVAANRYAIKNTLGQQIFFAHEESENLQRQCCGARRGFIMHITDNADQEVMRVSRDFKCCGGCHCCAGCDCCALEVSIEAPPGTPVGSVKQIMSCMQPKYQIKDTSDNVIFSVNGPAVVCLGAVQDQDFMVLSGESDQVVGKISKQWSGYIQEILTNADNFGITFPVDLDIKMKACMIGALFLIDFMYFEGKAGARRHRGYVRRGYPGQVYAGGSYAGGRM